MRDVGAAPTARTSAASSLLDRGWGRPEQTIATEERKEPGLVALLPCCLVALLQQMQARRPEEDNEIEEKV
jgi:hypothetical protein